jgi:hypothetical protein
MFSNCKTDFVRGVNDEDNALKTVKLLWKVQYINIGTRFLPQMTIFPLAGHIKDCKGEVFLFKGFNIVPDGRGNLFDNGALLINITPYGSVRLPF